MHPLLRTIAACALFLTVAALGLLRAQAPFGNYRFRLPASQGAAVACITPDLNGDGLADLVRASARDFGIWTQDKAGRFEPVTFPKLIPAGTGEIVALTTGRISSLRSLDILVAYRSGVVQVYPHLAASSSYGSPITLPALQGAVNPAIEQVLCGDLGGPSALDEIVVVLDLDRPVVYTPLGGRSFSQDMLIGPRVQAPRAVLADLDLDKDLDFVVFTGQPGRVAQPALYLNQNGSLRSYTAGFSGLSLGASDVLAVDVLGGVGPELVLAPNATNAAGVRVLRNISGTPGQPRYTVMAVVRDLFTVRQPKSLVLTDLDGDGFRDVLALSITGELTWGRSAGGASLLSFSAPQRLLAPAPRCCFCATDLESDGDIDVVVAGAGVEDSLLLGGPKGMAVLDLDTEDQGMPIGALASHLTAVVDFTGEGDPDIVMWPTVGGRAPLLLANDGGQARFAPVTYAGQVPALPLSSYFAARPATLGAGVRGILVAGKVTAGNPTAVRVFAPQSPAGLADQTARRWQLNLELDAILPADVSGRLRGSAGTAGLDDVVALDSAGVLRLVFNSQGIYAKQVPISTSRSPLGSELHVADLNLDGLPDVVVVEPSRIRTLLADPSQPDTFREGRPLTVGGPAALVRDLTGDAIPDVLLSYTPSTKKLLFLRGVGNGQFLNASASYLQRVPLQAEEITAFGFVEVQVGAASFAVLAGSIRGRDRILFGTPNGFASTALAPLRGSANTTGFLLQDFDVDGDVDLLVTRANSYPSLFLGQANDFCNVGVGQAGREALIRVTYPDLRTTGGLAIGFPVARIALPPLGILRMTRISVTLPVPAGATRAQSIRLPLPASMSTVQIPMQLFTISGAGALRFRNLDSFRPTNR